MTAAPGPPSLGGRARAALATILQTGWEQLTRRATMGPDQRRARAFGHFGHGSALCFPVAALYGEGSIRIGASTVIGPYATLSAGISPGHVLDRDTVITIGDRCLIGKGSGIVGHESIEIGDDVWTGHHVYVTDANHGYEDTSVPPSAQFAPPRPVVIGSGAWLGHGTVVLPGATIGRHVVIGAGSVVGGDIPDYSVAVGNPARVVKRYVAGEGWVRVDPCALDSPPGDDRATGSGNG
ncbi:MAG TPA: acyltransferase [Acidimicrobiia bacterium]|nr:acyltransferase [Acidimicrobiia bacterium]